MIAITGATGNLGRATIQQLLKTVSPENITAIVRDPNKLETVPGMQVKIADYDDYNSLVAAFSGADTLLQISSASYGDHATFQEEQVVKAAAAAGIQHLVYTSTLQPSSAAIFDGGRTCYNTEVAIRNSGMHYTIFRNSMYLETIPLFIGPAMETGQIRYPGGEGAISFVGREDIAKALAKVLAAPAKGGRSFNITGDHAYSFGDIARILGEERGLPATYTNISEEEFRTEMEGFGLPPEAVDFYSSMAASIRNREFSLTDMTWQQFLDKPTLDIRAFLGEN
ncbi:MAG: NAD(P)H-binding protein [Chitinophaga sp.]|uniref:NmrA family NAD(P)-binding protein n=1 Tax=Chitinophaga sp. TaxID=1869181 RepID=UPI0025BB331C|nr:NAD(P)H-binding protein [Chitinophaga sp.]MBV8253605.1 NAD(P)H-binding protein [Chitinophaga sp.]